MEKCIVCGRPLPEHTNMCGYCGFPVKKQYFLSKHQYRAWMNDVVLPRRLALQQFELNKQRRQLEEQQRVFQEQQRQFEEQKSKEIVAESVTSKPLTGWEHTGWESAKKKHTKRVQDRKNLSSWIPPGFRTKTWWKMLSAGFYYALAFYFSFLSPFLTTYHDSYGHPVTGILRFFFCIFSFLALILPCFFLANYHNMRSIVPAPSNRYLRWFEYYIIASILFELPAQIFIAICSII